MQNRQTVGRTTVMQSCCEKSLLINSLREVGSSAIGPCPASATLEERRHGYRCVTARLAPFEASRPPLAGTVAVTVTEVPCLVSNGCHVGTRDIENSDFLQYSVSAFCTVGIEQLLRHRPRSSLDPVSGCQTGHSHSFFHVAPRIVITSGVRHQQTCSP